MSNGGKGDAPRPKSVDEQTFGSNWDAIFKKPLDDSSSAYAGSPGGNADPQVLDEHP